MIPAAMPTPNCFLKLNQSNAFSSSIGFVSHFDSVMKKEYNITTWHCISSLGPSILSSCLSYV